MWQTTIGNVVDIVNDRGTDATSSIGESDTVSTGEVNQIRNSNKDINTIVIDMTKYNSILAILVNGKATGMPLVQLGMEQPAATTRRTGRMVQAFHIHFKF